MERIEGAGSVKCPSCRGAFPNGCSTCRPMYYTVGNFYPDRPIHTCPRCMRGLPCQPVDPSSLSSIVGALAEAPTYTRTYRSEADWKAEAFPSKEVM